MFCGVYLGLWPLKVIWGQKNIPFESPYMTSYLISMDNISLSVYLVPFSSYSTSKFLGFDLDFWPLNVIWGKTSLYYSKANICLPIWLLWTPRLYLVPNFDIFDFNVFRVWPWPLNPSSHLGSKYYKPFESPYTTSYLNSMDTISLSCTVLEIMLVKIFKAQQNGGFWPFKSQGQVSIVFYRRKGTSSHQTVSFEILRIKIGSAV